MLLLLLLLLSIVTICSTVAAAAVTGTAGAIDVFGKSYTMYIVNFT